MQEYELLFIVPNKYTDEEVDKITESVQKILTDFQGQIIKTENFGKRKLAYGVKQFYHGYYIQIHFDMPTDQIELLNNKLKLTSEVLRHIILLRSELSDKPISLKQDPNKVSLYETLPENRPKPVRKPRPARDDRRKGDEKKEERKAEEKPAVDSNQGQPAEENVRTGLDLSEAKAEEANSGVTKEEPKAEEKPAVAPDQDQPAKEENVKTGLDLSEAKAEKEDSGVTKEESKTEEKKEETKDEEDKKDDDKPKRTMEDLDKELNKLLEDDIII